MKDLPPKRSIKFFVGVDISKNKLDFAITAKQVVLLHQVIPNTTADIKAFLENIIATYGLKRSHVVFCMEDTGVYGQPLLTTLVQLKMYIVVENGYRILHSSGILREKNDRIDAIRLCVYAERNYQDLRAWEPVRPVIAKLKHLSTVRERLIGVSVKMKMPLKENRSFILEELSELAMAHSKRTLAALETDIEKIEKTIDKLISGDDRLTLFNNLIMSVPGIGKHTALQVLIRTNEFKDINDPKKFACYAGVVPFKKESGLKTGKAQVSVISNKKMKSLLHICAVRVIRIDPELRAYYERKLAENKSKMSVINAIRNKLVLRIFACVRDLRSYEPA